MIKNIVHFVLKVKSSQLWSLIRFGAQRPTESPCAFTYMTREHGFYSFVPLRTESTLCTRVPVAALLGIFWNIFHS